jgi:hypothetical protein
MQHSIRLPTSQTSIPLDYQLAMQASHMDSKAKVVMGWTWRTSLSEWSPKHWACLCSRALWYLSRVGGKLKKALRSKDVHEIEARSDQRDVSFDAFSLY